MGYTNFPHGLTSFGIPLPWGGGSMPMQFGDYYFVDPVYGSDSNEGTEKDRAFAGLEKAYDACVTNHHDVILINGQAGTGPTAKVNLTGMLTWAKNKIHVVGCGTFGRIDMGPEVKILNANKANDHAATLLVTGYGNSFTNLYISNGGTHTNSLSALWDYGENNVYCNCQFNKSSDLAVATVSNVRAWGDSTTWYSCKFGLDWQTQSVARPSLRLDGTGSGSRMQCNTFIDPIFMLTSSESTAYFVQIDSGNSMGGANLMINPVFIAGIIGSVSGAALDDCVLGHVGMVEGQLLLVNPSTNCDSICTVQAGGIKVVGPLTHVNAGFPQTPA